MSSRETGGKGQAVNREAVQARADYAIQLAKWADQVPQPPQTTMAKTMNDILAETCSKLAKIAACYNLQEALNDAQDGAVLAGGAAGDYFEQIQQDVNEAMGNLGCSAL